MNFASPKILGINVLPRRQTLTFLFHSWVSVWCCSCTTMLSFYIIYGAILFRLISHSVGLHTASALNLFIISCFNFDRCWRGSWMKCYLIGRRKRAQNCKWKIPTNTMRMNVHIFVVSCCHKCAWHTLKWDIQDLCDLCNQCTCTTPTSSGSESDGKIGNINQLHVLLSHMVSVIACWNPWQC